MTIRRIAWLGTVFAALALLLAALLDETILAKYGIPVPVLSLSAGHAHGVAALVVFLALSHDLDARLSIGAIVVMIMNLVVMLLTRRLLGLLAVVLPILGAVLGIVQVPLGLQIVHNSLRAMGLL